MPPLLKPGEVIEGEQGRWQVEKKIGEGQFSEVYQVLELGTQEQRAIKIDKKRDVQTVKGEYNTLQRLQQSCKQVVRAGQQERWQEGGIEQRPTSRCYMVMDLLGDNLTHMRRTAMGGRANLEAARVIGSSMLKALEGVHRAGVIHRDVKPANFVAAPTHAADPTTATWTLLDFGLARQFTDREGALLHARPQAAFRGSTTYASVNCLQAQDQSRRDDMWGWLYCLVELIEGTLPWRGDGGGGGGCEVPGGQLLPSPPQDACAAGGLSSQPSLPLGGGAGGGSGRLSKDLVLQRKLECLDQPQLLFSSMACPKAEFTPRPAGRQWRAAAAGEPGCLMLSPPLEPPSPPPPPPPMLTPPVLCLRLRLRPLLRLQSVYDISHYLRGLGFGDGVDYQFLRARLNELGSGEEAPPRAPLLAQPPVTAAAPPANGLHTGGGVGDPAAAAPGGRAGDGASRQLSRAASPAAPLERRPSRLGQPEAAAVAAAVAAAAGREAQQPEQQQQQQGEHQQLQQQAGASGLSKQRSRDRSRERRGRERRSRSRGRRSRSRERYGRSRSRERYGGGRRSHSRDRSRDRSRSQERERGRGRGRRRRSSRSRSHERQGRRGGDGARRRGASRSRSRSPRGGGARQQHRREGSSAGGQGPTPAPAGQPAAGAAGEPPAAAAQAGPAGVSKHQGLSEADAHQHYRGVLDYVSALRQGALSEPAAAACRQMRALEPSEAAGVLCWVLDELATATDPQHLPVAAAFCQEIAAFAAGTAKRCVERSRQQQR
ncbi:hypothetical protein CHLNCDRAFT_133409 [Chlorella variabilis]|uniref:Protein kinase domain-containing protein n=1 Tax=Chlorella variabilis TaxID=554065 RepID=E1Z316_CHLVA|nr:hypothetical protein CHLNCDRAFT_133409 [Chlorella variabilis]EFN60093.1 hypothetical protein CHLNCDRAFT_133409 [Chlorella variabilis]|eukprot:XP_005852195.1 hypothetical protein CHLNCDRAFT_133409 [Chlorella variabilis]